MAKWRHSMPLLSSILGPTFFRNPCTRSGASVNRPRMSSMRSFGIGSLGRNAPVPAINTRWSAAVIVLALADRALAALGRPWALVTDTVSFRAAAILSTAPEPCFSDGPSGLLGEPGAGHRAPARTFPTRFGRLAACDHGFGRPGARAGRDMIPASTQTRLRTIFFYLPALYLKDRLTRAR